MTKKILIGLLAGIICGLFTTGGGMILVPAFMYILKKESVESRATSVCCILVMVIASSFFYYKNNYIDWNSGFLCAIRRNNWRIHWSKAIRQTSRLYTKNSIYSIFNICLNKNDILKNKF